MRKVFYEILFYLDINKKLRIKKMINYHYNKRID